MTNYRRNFIAGGTFFFTVALADRSSRLLTEQIDALRLAFRLVRTEHPFSLDAVVILPDHLHTIWTLPPEDADFAMRWKKIKAAFSRQLPKTEQRSDSRIAKGERGIWQRRYWEHTIRDECDLQAHADYIHFNPVKHGYVERVRDWPYSSFHRYVRLGVCPEDWAGSTTTMAAEYGERK